MTGPLAGVRVVELGGIGPGPFAAMVLADLGADVLTVERAGSAGPDPERASFDVLGRSRSTIAVDLKADAGREVVLALIDGADVLLEGFRPGVTARLGVGPDAALARNPRLVYGQMTGWGQQGPLADRAGHDITYAAIGGALAHIGRRGQPPTPPLNLVADFGGGGMLRVAGILAALVERATSGEGQVVDAAMVDGVALLMAPFWGAAASGFWSDERGTNMLDSGTPFYDCYQCADGEWVAVGALEPQFFAELVDGLGLDADWPAHQHDQSRWDELREAIAATFLTRPRDAWAEHFAGRDACVAPVLTMSEAAEHPHVRARATVSDALGSAQPAPAPRFSRSSPAPPRLPRRFEGSAAVDLLESWSVPAEVIEHAQTSGALA